MRNCRTNWSVASLDAIEKPRDSSDVSLTHFAAEPHNNLDTLRGEGGGKGIVLFYLIFKLNSIMTRNNFHVLQGGGRGVFALVLFLSSIQ